MTGRLDLWNVLRRRVAHAPLFALALAAIAAFAPPATAQDTTRTYAKAPPLPDLTGKVVMITGSTDGLGRDAARRIAAAGAHVIISGRSAPRGSSGWPARST